MLSGALVLLVSTSKFLESHYSSGLPYRPSFGGLTLLSALAVACSFQKVAYILSPWGPICCSFAQAVIILVTTTCKRGGS